jgi:hypothetical protein
MNTVKPRNPPQTVSQPLSGDDSEENLITICASCHAIAHNRGPKTALRCASERRQPAASWQVEGVDLVIVGADIDHPIRHRRRGLQMAISSGVPAVPTGSDITAD